MKTENYLFEANDVTAYLQKPCSAITREDLIDYIREKEIKMINFLYPGGDAKLKTLNFIITDYEYLENILTYGERVDGSSLFTFVEAGSSDLYVVPRYSTAFLDPFSEIPTLNLLCAYFDKDGKPLESAPAYTLKKAAKAFTDVSGYELHAMGELEYYVIIPDDHVFPAVDQRGYHESLPYAKTTDFRRICMSYIARAGGKIKYGHSEVGNFSQDGLLYEQNEIEFQPVPISDAADQLLIAKWIIRNLAYRMGVNVTFAPKITTGKAGSGMHIHMRLMKDGQNVTLADGKLSEASRKAISGLMTLAPSLTAFGNKNPMSYFRLVPHQEAPTSVCWGDRNRSVLVRVPLGWAGQVDMCHTANPQQPEKVNTKVQKQTFELRSPDGSADCYQLLAGLCVACRYGFEQPDALAIAEKTYVDVNIHAAESAQKLAALDHLPDSCVASAKCLQAQRDVYEAHGVFSSAMISDTVLRLEQFDDASLRDEVSHDPIRLQELVDKFFHCG